MLTALSVANNVAVIKDDETGGVFHVIIEEARMAGGTYTVRDLAGIEARGPVEAVEHYIAVKGNPFQKEEQA